MKSTIGKLLAITMLSIFSITACTKDKPQNNKLQVGVTIAPQAWLAQQIGGNEVEVNTLIAPGISPETFDPSPKDMANIFSSKIFFIAGFAFEHHIIEKMAAHKQQVLIDPSDNHNKRYFGANDLHHHHHHHHQHGDAATDGGFNHQHHCPHYAEHHQHSDAATDGGFNHQHHCPHYAEHHQHSDAATDGGFNHQHREIDPHFWFSIDQMRHHAQVMAAAMTKAKPEAAAVFTANLKLLNNQLDQLEQEGRELLTPYKGRAFLVFHPTYGYLADDYGLDQVAIEVDGKEPSPQQLVNITDKAKTHKINTIIVQPQFPYSAASAIAEAIHGQVVVVDSLSNDYPAMFRHLINTLAVSFKDADTTTDNEQ